MQRFLFKQLKYFFAGNQHLIQNLGIYFFNAEIISQKIEVQMCYMVKIKVY